MTASVPDAAAGRPPRLAEVLGDEGFRLFFPLCALYAALWPALWVLVHRLDLPLARGVPPGLWHAHEMLFGAFGAALLGFLTTAVPEWTDTPRLRGRALFALAGAWAAARLVGLAGADALVPAAAVADAAWLAALGGYLLHVSWRRRTTRLLAFAAWIAALLAAEIAIRVAFATGAVAAAERLLHVAVLLLVGLLGLALARISVPVTNLVLDPSGRSSPFRPHPGRLNLAPGLVAIAAAGDLLPLSPAVTGFLWIAAGAAMVDRVAEGFIGRAALRSEILALGGAAAFAGLGLLLVGASRLGAPIAEKTALHVAVMGGLGLGVVAVFAVAGRLHTGRPLGLGRWARAALVLVVAGMALRVAPDLGWFDLPGPLHGIAATVWAAALLCWLRDEWPALSDPATLGARRC